MFLLLFIYTTVSITCSKSQHWKKKTLISSSEFTSWRSGCNRNVMIPQRTSSKRCVFQAFWHYYLYQCVTFSESSWVLFSQNNPLLFTFNGWKTDVSTHECSLRTLHWFCRNEKWVKGSPEIPKCLHRPCNHLCAIMSWNLSFFFSFFF